jgi:hypothetical protein
VKSGASDPTIADDRVGRKGTDETARADFGGVKMNSVSGTGWFHFLMEYNDIWVAAREYAITRGRRVLNGDAVSVTQRTQEIGVRRALGARPIEITGLIVREGVQLTTWGIFLGLIGGAIAGRLISTLLFDVRVLDPVSLAGGVAMILAASLLASYLPARRASHLDPMVALRYE